MPSKQPISVAFVYDDSLDGSDGVTQQVKTLGAWLSRRGHKVSYFVGRSATAQWEGGKVYSLSKNLRVVFNGNRMSIPLFAKRSAIKKALAEAESDILHVQMPHSPLMAQRVINAAGLPVLGTFHVYPAGVLPRVGGNLLRLMYLGGLNKIDRVVSVSPAAAEYARASFGIDSDVVPNMVEASRFSNTKVQPLPGKIVFLGRLVERKGCRNLIEAFTAVSREVPDSRLEIAGGGPQRQELEKLVKRLNLSNKVKFLGFVPEADKPALLASAQIACFPSLYGESFGIVLIEAMAAGAGVVLGADNPGYSSVLAETPEALFDAKDSQALAVKLIHFLRNQDEAARLHAKQAEMVKRYDVNQVGAEIEKRYRALIANHLQKRHN